MECAHLDILIVPVSKGKLPICKNAGRSYGRSFYSPTIFQLRQFCRKHDHARCPFYLRNEEVACMETIIPAINKPLAPKKNIAG